MFPSDFPVRFENPVYGLAGMILVSTVVVLLYLSHKKLKAAQKHLEIVEWKTLRRIMRILNISTKTVAVIALSSLLATPYLPTTIEVPVDVATEEQKAQYTTTILLLMDVSYSMNCSDFEPTRLRFAKTLAKLLVNKLDSKDLVGFVSFAGQVYDTVLPTTNRTRIIQKIDSQVTQPSTAIGTALETAIGVLETYSLGGKAIILFSDGKNNIGANVASATNEVIVQGIPVFTVSLGTYGMGEANPLALREISNRTDGEFYEAKNEEIENLVTSASQISVEVKAGALKAVYDKLIVAAKDYHTPTVILSVLLVAGLFLMWFTGV